MRTIPSDTCVLSILVRSFERPIGVAADGDRIALGVRDQVWQFCNAPELAAHVEPAGAHEACFLPRASDVTGDVSELLRPFDRERMEAGASAPGQVAVE